MAHGMPNPSAFLTLCKAWLGRVCSISAKVWRCELGCLIGKPIRSLVGIMPPPSLLLFYSGVDSLFVLCPTSRVPHRNMDLVSMPGGTLIELIGKAETTIISGGGEGHFNEMMLLTSIPIIHQQGLDCPDCTRTRYTTEGDWQNEAV
jgi:hypothetical protein